MREFEDRRQIDNIYEKAKKRIKEQIELKGVSCKGGAKGQALSEIIEVLDKELEIDIAEELITARRLLHARNQGRKLCPYPIRVQVGGSRTYRPRVVGCEAQKSSQGSEEKKMTIASADKEIGGLIDNFDVYGAEAVINALVRACRGKRFLGKKALLNIFDRSFKVWGNKEGVKCAKCGDIFSSEEIEDFRFEHEPFGKDPFICPDCYDRLVRQDLEDQFKELMDETYRESE